MMSLKSIDQFNTSRGKTYIVESQERIKVDDSIIIDGKEEIIKHVTMQTRPGSSDIIALTVFDRIVP